MIYGTSKKRNGELRTFKNGQLKTLDTSGQQFPINSPNPSQGCPIPNVRRCFYGGKLKKFAINKHLLSLLSLFAFIYRLRNCFHSKFLILFLFISSPNYDTSSSVVRRKSRLELYKPYKTHS